MTGVLLLLATLPTQEPVKGEADDPRLGKLPFAMNFDLVNRGPHKRVVALEGDVSQLVPLVEARGGKILVRTQTVVTALVRGEDTTAFLDSKAVRRFDLGPTIDPPVTTYAVWRNILRKDSATALPASQWKTGSQTGSLNLVHQGRSPLTKAYKGKGVLIAVIEPDLPDFRHPDFRNADGTTRFHAIWDTRAEGAGMAGISYGKVYTSNELNKLLKSGEANRMVFGQECEHPTNATGAIGGSGRASGLYQGVAPEAKLMFVSTGPNNVALINAAAAVFREADRLGMPCVLSVSMGPDQLIGRADDGRDLCSVAISELVEAKPGRCFVTAAGNNGHVAKLHWEPEVAQGEEKRVWIYPELRKGSNSFAASLLLEGEKRRSVEFQISAVAWTKEGYRVAESTEWVSAESLAQSGPQRFSLTREVEGAPYGLTVRLAPRWNPDESAVIALYYSANTHAKTPVTPLLEVKFRGRGKAELWTEVFAPMVGKAFPLPNATLPDDLGEPDNLRGISSPGGGRSVIVAGAYSDASGEVVKYTQPGGRYHGSYRPQILSPTDVIVANPLDSPKGDDQLFGQGRYVRFGGTSCATPMLAGAAALYFEKHPRATVRELEAALRAAAYGDEQTGIVPNPRSGFGKLDYFRLMQR